MNAVTFTDDLRRRAERFREALDAEGTLVIRRDDLDRWRDATPEEWAAGRLDA